MIKLIKILLFLFIIPAPGFSQQQEINNLDNQGRKTGLWKKYYENGNLLYEGNFQQGKPLGTLKRYYNGGVLKADMNFCPDGIQSYAKLYYENRILAAEGKYIRQVKDSIWNYYSFYNKRLTIKENYLDGKKNGTSIKYYDDGSVAEFMYWEKDIMHGPWEQFYENGQLRLKCTNVEGVRDGEFSSFNWDGTKSICGNYIMGIMDGLWKYYSKDNIVDIEVEYVDGKMLPNAKLAKKNKEFSKMIEESIGKYQEPDISNFR